MATLKSLLKTASEELRTAQFFHPPTDKPHISHHATPIHRFTTPAIHIHDPSASEKLLRYLTTATSPISAAGKSHWNHLETYIIPAQTQLSLHMCHTLTSMIVSHIATSETTTAFAVAHAPNPDFRNFSRYLAPFTKFPMLTLGTSSRSALSPLAVCHYFLALHTCGILLPPDASVPWFMHTCVVEHSEHFRYVRGRGETAYHAFCALVRAVCAGALEKLSTPEIDRTQEIDAIRKWALEHPASRGSVHRLRRETPEGYAHHKFGMERHPVVQLLTNLSTPFPASTRIHSNKPMIRATTPRKRWHFLSFLDILSPNSRISSLAVQNPELCQQLAPRCHTYILTCLDGRERGFHVCHWGGMDCMPVVVEMEIVEEGDGSRSIVAMRLVDEMSVRVSFKALARASVGKVVCWRGCCGLVEHLGLFVCGVPGDQLAVPDCSLWFIGLI